MPKYQLGYTKELKFRPGAIKAVREAIKAGLFKANKNTDEKMFLLRELGDKMLSAYSQGREALALVQVAIEPNRFFGPQYHRQTKTILLDKPSLVSFLHELAHHLQFARDGSTSEEYARAFSLGLFRRAAPLLFDSAVNKGMLLYVKAQS